MARNYRGSIYVLSHDEMEQLDQLVGLFTQAVHDLIMAAEQTCVIDDTPSPAAEDLRDCAQRLQEHHAYIENKKNPPPPIDEDAINQHSESDEIPW